MCRISHIPGRPNLDGARVVVLDNSDLWAHELPEPDKDEFAIMLQHAKGGAPQTMLVKRHYVVPHTVAQLMMDERMGQTVMTSPRRREHIERCLRSHRDRSYTSNVIGAPFSVAYERIGLDRESAWWRRPSVGTDASLGLSTCYSIPDQERVCKTGGEAMLKQTSERERIELPRSITRPAASPTQATHPT